MSSAAVSRRFLFVVWLARIAVATVFAVAAIGKIIDPAGFAETVSNYLVFPRWSWNTLALVVPMIEIVGAVGLLTGFKRRGATLVLAALTFGFLILIGSALMRGLDVNCGCFGSSSADPLSGYDFLADVGLLVAILVAGWSPRLESADSSHTSRASPGRRA
jgi:uncharacterized membrane protein YphA (DoxX/SURF4 family)